MSVRDAIEAAINSKLTTTAGTALWGQRVYYGQAPGTVSPPYVVFQHVSGGDANMMPSRVIDELFQVVFWTNDAQQARTGGDYIETALRNVTLSVTGYNFMDCSQRGFISDVETADGVQYWSEGGEYRIRVSDL